MAGIEELRQFPKVHRAEVFGDEVLVIETNDVYLYTEKRDLRSRLGRFTLVFTPEKIAFINKDRIVLKEKWQSYQGGSWSDNLHHPHITGSYVSLAAHEKPLGQAMHDKDWLQVGFISFKFLEDYKFGEKAKKFFERHMEEKTDEGWKEVTDEERRDTFLGREDFKFSGYSYSYGNGKFGKEAEDQNKKDFPVGTEIVLVNTTVRQWGVHIGMTGTVTGHWNSTIEVDWDNYAKFSVMSSDKIKKLKNCSETELAELKARDEERFEHHPARRPKFADDFPIKSRVRLLYSNSSQAPERGAEGEIVGHTEFALIVKWDSMKTVWHCYPNSGDKLYVVSRPDERVEGEANLVVDKVQQQVGKPPIIERHAS